MATVQHTISQPLAVIEFTMTRRQFGHIFNRDIPTPPLSRPFAFSLSARTPQHETWHVMRHPGWGVDALILNRGNVGMFEKVWDRGSGVEW
eukprot:12076893-Alexandrium_andersonii.AAC.1